MKTKKVIRIVLIYIFTVLLLKFFLIIPTRWVLWLLSPFWVTFLLIAAYLIIMFIIVYFLNLLKSNKTNEQK